MVKSSADRRTVRTKNMIKDAFIKLLSQKGFNSISITEITEKADINRGTFYLHYKDKYDLMEKLENELVENLHAIIESVSYIDLMAAENRNKPAPFLVKIFEFFKENNVFIKSLLGPKGDPIFHSKLKRTIENNLFENIIKTFNNYNITIPKKYFVNYIVSAHIGVIQQWLEDGMEESPEDMALILTKMFYQGPYKTVAVNGIQ